MALSNSQVIAVVKVGPWFSTYQLGRELCSDSWQHSNLLTHFTTWDKIGIEYNADGENVKTRSNDAVENDAPRASLLARAFHRRRYAAGSNGYG